MHSRRQHGLLLLLLLVTLLLCVSSVKAAEAVEEAEEEEATCDDAFSALVWLSVPVYVALLCCIFVAFFVLCEHYFMASMIALCAKLNLTEDVAGATFLAAGSSSPELFSALLDTFVYKNSIGIGTVVGSAVFNVLCGLAICAYVAPQQYNLTKSAIWRDSFFFFISICCVLVFFADGKVEWFESLILLLFYGVYVGCLTKHQLILDTLGYEDAKPMFKLPEEDIQETMELHDLSSSDTTYISMSEDTVSTPGGLTAATAATAATATEGTTTRQNRTLSTNDFIVHERQQLNLAEEANTLSPLVQAVKTGLEYLEKPWVLLFKYTIPNCDNPTTAHKWPFTFGICVLYFILLCWLVVLLGTVLSCVTHIPPAVMGVTLLAVGTSLPDALGGISAAKNGYMAMAIGNALGSNCFDIFLALGLPWFLYSAVNGEAVLVDPHALVVPVVCMFLVMLILLLELYWHQWRFDGVSTFKRFMALYAVFIVYEVVAIFIS